MISSSFLVLLFAFFVGIATPAKAGSLLFQPDVKKQTVMDNNIFSTSVSSSHHGRDQLQIGVDFNWQLLGPFPTGMREQDFGADPLEAFGGFRELKYDEDAKYPSELARDGVVRWQTTQMDREGWINISYPEIDWKFNQQFLGWAFNQFQAWARSTFTIPSHIGDGDGLCPVIIQCENVGDFYVDDQRLSGDWYGYGLTRHTLRLKPGIQHILSVRVVHEVRIFGGVITPPPSKFKCELKIPFATWSKDLEPQYQHHRRHQGMTVQVIKEGYGGLVLMDLVDDALAGKYISVALRNVDTEKVLVQSVKVLQGSDRFKAELKDVSTGIRLTPSSHRPIVIRLEETGAKASNGALAPTFTLEFQLKWLTPAPVRNGDSKVETLETDPITLKQRKWGEVYHYTFLDFDNTVQYAAAIPPSDPSSQPKGFNSVPVIVALHGAGVEVSQKSFWLTEYKRREHSWVVLPTGRSPWGYDWHGASIKNVMSAIQSLSDSLPGVPKHLRGLPGIKPDPERLLMAGHSNGGQGAWYFVTHFPDKAIAATPAAGYVNIKQYVPYLGWQSDSYTDSHLRGLLEASIIEFDNNLHMSNTVGVPILARTGSEDDNVPPFNSRKMVRLGQENAHDLSAIRLSEVSGEGHWFTGALHDETMQKFLKGHLFDNITSGAVEASISHPFEDFGSYRDNRTGAKAVTLPPFPKSFEITVINPAGMGSRGGIQVEQLHIPFRKGTIRVQAREEASGVQDGAVEITWELRTTNIRRFQFLDSSLLQQRRGGRLTKLIVDGVTFYLGDDDNSCNNRGATVSNVAQVTFVRDHLSKTRQHSWQFMTSSEWSHIERNRDTYGPAIQVLEKRLVVIVGTNFSGNGIPPDLVGTADRISKLIAHDIYLYGRGDVEVMDDEEYMTKLHRNRVSGDTSTEKTNLVLIGDAHQNSATKHVLAQTFQEVTIEAQRGCVSIDPRPETAAVPSEFCGPGIGLLMIRPWGSSNLAMVIAGVDSQGLETAARLFPKRTGLLVPDWIVTGPEMGWKGAGGILAAGFWGNHWEYLPTMSA